MWVLVNIFRGDCFCIEINQKVQFGTFQRSEWMCNIPYIQRTYRANAGIAQPHS